MKENIFIVKKNYKERKIKIRNLKKYKRINNENLYQLNHLKFECIFFDCKENFTNYQLWKIHFEKHVKKLFIL
jgi:hypothetical protein